MRTIHPSDIEVDYTYFHPDDAPDTKGWEFLTVEQKKRVTWFGSEEFGKETKICLN